jgi:hypothetical protein
MDEVNDGNERRFGGRRQFFFFFFKKRELEGVGVYMGRVKSSSGRVILFCYYFLSDSNSTRLNSGQKILTRNRPDGSRIDPDPIREKFYYLESNPFVRQSANYFSDFTYSNLKLPNSIAP